MLMGDWPVQGGARCIPAGTIVGDGGIPTSELPMLPINAMAMDDEAARLMRQLYPTEIHRLMVGPDVGKSQPPKKRTSAKGS
jgi:hypothetical protein